MRSSMLWVDLSMTLAVWTSTVESRNGGAFPAADIPTQCNSAERCCMPTPYTGTPGIREFKLDSITAQPWRTRRPVHLLTPFEVSRLERAFAMLRALPDSDPRSFLNQNKLHCLYCDFALSYPGHPNPLEIHFSWFFLPWHRMFLFWFERILAHLVEDDSFALPFWAWDSSQEMDPLPNSFPAIYYNQSSSLWDPNRNNCSTPETLVDLDGRGCTNKTAAFVRQQNDRLTYTQFVTGAPTPELFYGLPYYLGDYGGQGSGTFQFAPHGRVHGWVGDPNAKPPLHIGDDMLSLGRAALDPVFYAHHSNVDRLWLLWQGLPGGVRTMPMDRAFNDSMFTFYDENANLVKMSVQQTLDMDLLRYNYEDVPTPWVTNGVLPGQENTLIPLCNPLSRSATEALICNTTKFQNSQVLGMTPITFRLERPKVRLTNATEVLELSGIHIPDVTSFAAWTAFLFFPQASVANGPTCPEFTGVYGRIPITGQATFNPDRVWRVAVGPKLVQIGQDDVKDVVVTLVQTSPPPGHIITIRQARIFYDFGPS